MPKKTTSTESQAERTFLVGIELRGAKQPLSVEDSLAELALLADTAGMSVVGEIYQKVNRPDPNTFIGSGKAGELKDFVEETMANTVVFDEELSPRHQRQLEGILGDKVKVLDRTALILDIFAQHAHTREGTMQVELAQYEYRLPRLTRQWTHLARQAGGGAGRSGAVGGVGLRGPGETQLEVDRREIARKIAYLKVELEKIRAHRGRYRAQRKRSAVPVVAIVGYTNAGKSTLLNRLSGASVYAADQLFATLDPTTRRVELPGGKAVLFTDTVGFIQKLPTTLVAAFRATLEEIAEADVLLHVVDLAHPNALEQAQAVQHTLGELEISGIPVVTVLNKIDRLGGLDGVIPDLKGFPNVTPVSALEGLGLDQMLERIQDVLQQALDPIDARVPYAEGQLISIFHEQAVVELVEHEDSGVRLKGRVPKRIAHRFKPFLIRRRQRE